MSSFDLPPLRAAWTWHRAGVDEWNDLEPTTQVRAKVAILLALTAIAYHYSLISLIRTATSDTPLAYLGLVPILAGGLAYLNRRPRNAEPPIEDRQLDFTIGLPLIAIALLAGIVLPSRLGAMFWVDRIDLICLPVFVTGATILLFGVRVAWRQRLALGYLFLAWPVPYTSVLLGTLNGFRGLTVGALRALLHVVKVGTPVGPASDGMFHVVHAGHPFVVSVLTPCSGVDSMVGFLLVGAAFLGIVEGSKRGKALWLASGFVLLWVTNLVRLLAIFWIGEIAGPHLAIDVIHPILGILLFIAAVGALSAALGRYGLRVRQAPAQRATAPIARRQPPIRTACLILVIAAVVLARSNASLRVFDPVASASGDPRIGSFMMEPASPAGWTPAYETEFTSNKPLFGQDSRWIRYLYSPTDASRSNLRSSVPVTADVINSASLDGFNSYGVTACYSFHGYKLHDVEDVDLGGGIAGQALSYSGGTTHQDWSLVYWVWPVKTATGTRFERVILYLQNTPAAHVWVHGGVDSRRTPPGDDEESHLLEVNRIFLVDFAKQIIQGQTDSHDTGLDVAAFSAPGSQGAAWATTTEHLAQAKPSASLPPRPQSAKDIQAWFWLHYAATHPRTAK